MTTATRATKSRRRRRRRSSRMVFSLYELLEFAKRSIRPAHECFYRQTLYASVYNPFKIGQFRFMHVNFLRMQLFCSNISNVMFDFFRQRGCSFSSKINSKILSRVQATSVPNSFWISMICCLSIYVYVLRDAILKLVPIIYFLNFHLQFVGVKQLNTYKSKTIIFVHKFFIRGCNHYHRSNMPNQSIVLVHTID